MKKMRKGFTLIELLIVIAVLGALTAMMTLSSSGAVGSANAAKITHGLQVLRTASQAFVAEYANAANVTITSFDKLSTDYIDATYKDEIQKNFILVVSGNVKDTTVPWYAGYKATMTDETKRKLADHATENKLIGGTGGTNAGLDTSASSAVPYATTHDGVYLRIH